MSSNRALSRRQFVQGLGVTATLTLAGCSGGTDTPATDSTETPTNAATSGDRQHSGEKVVEQTLTESGLYWIELEDTSEQITDSLDASFLREHGDAFDFESETITHQTGANEGTTYDVDTAYITVESTERGWYAQIGYIDASKWQDGEGFEGNRFRATAFAGGEAEQSTLETLFADDVTGYSDSSAEFPSQFTSLLDQ